MRIYIKTFIYSFLEGREFVNKFSIQVIQPKEQHGPNMISDEWLVRISSL